jgi:hypothetical protein
MTETNPTAQHTKLSFNPDAYREYVRDMGLSASQEDDLLKAVWSVVVGILDFTCGPHVLEGADADVKSLAADSASVLACLSTSEIIKAEDAMSNERTIARRIDS